MTERTEKGWATLVYREEQPTTEWRKSSYSGGGNDCVEIAFRARAAGVRDSKNAESGALWLTPRDWHAFGRTAIQR